VLPACGRRIKSVEIVEALSVGSRATKEIEIVSNITEGHACSGRRALTFNYDLTPEVFV